MEKVLTPDEQEFVSTLESGLPPVIARKQVERFLGGMVSRKVLANADSRGEGPEESYAVGKCVVYKTRSLLHWLVRRRNVRKLVDVRNLGV